MVQPTLFPNLQCSLHSLIVSIWHLEYHDEAKQLFVSDRTGVDSSKVVIDGAKKGQFLHICQDRVPASRILLVFLCLPRAQMISANVEIIYNTSECAKISQ